MQALSGILSLLMLSLLMLVASFASGMLPLVVSLSPDRLRAVSTVGMGVLMGTSLIVIIPEGVETLYSVPRPRHRRPKIPSGLGSIVPPLDHNPFNSGNAKDGADGEVEGRDPVKRGVSAALETIGLRIRETPPHHDQDDPATKPLDGEDDEDDEDKNDSDDLEPSDGKSSEDSDSDDDDDDDDDEDTEDGAPSIPGNPRPPSSRPSASDSTHKYVGIALISGFIMMYLIDKLPAILGGNGMAAHLHHRRSIDDVAELQTFSSSSGATSGLSPEEGLGMASLSSRSSPPPSVGPLISGLVIHAAADGIALGASAASSSVALETIVFFAILIHKAPAAFGLSAVLLRNGISRGAVKKHLFIFSIAAPIGAVVTWMIIMMIGSNSGDATIQWWTGIILLFSGGTFLYVAVHVMNDSEAEGKSSDQVVALKDAMFAVAGMLIPLVTLTVKDV
ncbi:ZIP zinc transporter-domain-containing protein [Myxozyma melibiosi]|uniref:ZIP zinc transporter-domain-containing protein n=1 Tax=Myxozyma melibiosi TaxID=54550 RepID=A0ABR1FB88_9ASCO